MHDSGAVLHKPNTVFPAGFSVGNKCLTLSEDLNMNAISKTSLVAFLSLISSSVFAGLSDPVITVSEPSVLALMGAGAVAVLYIAKKRKK